VKKKLLLTLFVAGLWLANSFYCICCEEDHSPSSNESGPEDCGFCCGHQVFTAAVLAETSDLPPQENFVIEGLTFSDQLNFRSIYHPPKA